MNLNWNLSLLEPFTLTIRFGGHSGQNSYRINHHEVFEQESLSLTDQSVCLIEMSETTYNKILEAAAQCFSKDGFDGTTMDQIAKNASVSKGALYWHFRNKEQLFVQLKKRHITQILQTLKRSLASAGTFDSKLEKGFELYFSPLTPQNRRIARLDMEFWAGAPKIFGLSQILNNQYDRLQAFLKAIINEYVKKGELKKDIDARSLSAILLATFDGLELHWAILEKDFDWQKIRKTLLDAILNGLKP